LEVGYYKRTHTDAATGCAGSGRCTDEEGYGGMDPVVCGPAPPRSPQQAGGGGEEEGGEGEEEEWEEVPEGEEDAEEEEADADGGGEKMPPAAIVEIPPGICRYAPICTFLLVKQVT
jgi:hypothetical protein